MVIQRRRRNKNSADIKRYKFNSFVDYLKKKLNKLKKMCTNFLKNNLSSPSESMSGFLCVRLSRNSPWRRYRFYCGRIPQPRPALAD